MNAMSQDVKTTRRAVLTGAAALPAIGISNAIGHTTDAVSIPAADPDPIFAAIEKHKQLSAAANEQLCKITDLQDAASRNDRQPIALVAWRNYSHIGGSEIEARRKEFLAEPGANPKTVEREYRKVKAAYRAKLRAEAAWSDRHGITPLRMQNRRLWQQVNEAECELSSIRPTTAAGMGALVAYARAEILEYQDFESWGFEALASAATTLRKMPWSVS
jgi:hypothetical protein